MLRSGVWISGLAMVLMGCATVESGVEAKVLDGASPLPLQTYAITVDDMPGFLVPYFRDELVGVLANAGAQEVATDAEVEFTLRYEDVDLSINEAPLDSFGEGASMERPARFIARVTIEAWRPGVDKPTMTATMSRVHQVAVGAYMHQRSRAAIRRAYEEILGVVR